jgi:hypothetical protein
MAETLVDQRNIAGIINLLLASQNMARNLASKDGVFLRASP